MLLGWGYLLMCAGVVVIYIAATSAAITWRSRQLRPRHALLSRGERRELEADAVRFFSQRLNNDREARGQFLGLLANHETLVHARVIQRATQAPQLLEKFVVHAVRQLEDVRLVEFMERVDFDEALRPLSERAAQYRESDRTWTWPQLLTIVSGLATLLGVLAYPPWQQIHKHRIQSLAGTVFNDTGAEAILSRESLGHQSAYRGFYVAPRRDRFSIRPTSNLQRSEVDLLQVRIDYGRLVLYIVALLSIVVALVCAMRSTLSRSIRNSLSSRPLLGRLPKWGPAPS